MSIIYTHIYTHIHAYTHAQHTLTYTLAHTHNTHVYTHPLTLTSAFPICNKITNGKCTDRMSTAKCVCVCVCVFFFLADWCAFLIICLGRTLQLRGGAFLEDANQRRGHCAETGSWLGTYGLPHTDAHNLTVVFPTDTQHDLKIGKGASWPPKVENGYQIDNEFLVEDSWLQRQPLVDWVRILVSSLHSGREDCCSRAHM